MPGILVLVTRTSKVYALAKQGLIFESTKGPVIYYTNDIKISYIFSKLKDVFTITNSQIRDITDASLCNFRARLWQHLARFFPGQQFVPLDAWPSYFIAGLDLAKRYRMQTEYGITVLFNLLFTFQLSTAELDKQTWIQEVLSQKPASEAEMTKLLMEAAERQLEQN